MEDLPDAWQNLALIQSRFRREISWLQFPVTAQSLPKADPHAPTTRALELNVDILKPMLDCCSFEFLGIDRLTKQAMLHFCVFPALAIE